MNFDLQLELDLVEAPEYTNVTEEETLRAIPNVSVWLLQEKDSELVSRLTKLESQICRLQLSAIIDQLVILGAKRSKAEPKIGYKTLRERFIGTVVMRPLYDPDSNNLVATTADERRWTKFQKDREWAVKALSVGNYELAETQTMVGLEQVTSTEGLRQKEEEQLEMEFYRNEETVEQFNDDIDRNQNLTRRLAAEKELKLTALEDDLQESLYKCSMEIAYNEHWEKARAEQNRWTLKIKEKQMLDTIAECYEKDKKETAINQTIMKFLNDSQVNMISLIKTWTKRYNQDVEEKDTQIGNLRQRTYDTKEKIVALKNEFTDRKGEIDEYLVERNLRIAIEEEKRKVESMATRIQAWWRGVMVRRKLGPYAPVKKKEKEEKKKKKKKK